MPAGATIDAPPAIRSRLRKLGLERQQDLVLHLPLRYEDETRITGIAEAPFGVPVQVEGELLDHLGQAGAASPTGSPGQRCER
jgi:ATP-dependent DNA helicase RecG